MRCFYECEKQGYQAKTLFSCAQDWTLQGYVIPHFCHCMIPFIGTKTLANQKKHAIRKQPNNSKQPKLTFN